MKRLSAVLITALLGSAFLAGPASADSTTEGFSGFAVASPLQPANDWAYTGGSSYDVATVPNGIDNSVRISNAKTSSSFGDWLFSKPLAVPATETGLQEFTATFDIGTTSPDPQPGLHISVSPQTNGGARMSYLRFEDQSDGVHVFFDDVMNLNGTETWRDLDIATLTRSDVHHVKIVMDLLKGAHNDVVQVYIDGTAPLVPGITGPTHVDGFYAPVDNPEVVNKAKAGQTIPMKWTATASSFATSWEDYYRYNSESNAGIDQAKWTTRQVDSLLFKAGGAAAPATQDGGFLIDNVATASTANATLPVATVPVTSYADANPFTSARYTTDAADTTDAIETYASGASGLRYLGSGVWQYNWQTPKDLAGRNVKLTLDGTDKYALFQFTK